MLSPTLSTLRLFLHVLGAAVWVGGQVVLAGMVPQVRKQSPAALKAITHGFARLAIPGLFLVFVTGIWSMFEIDFSDRGAEFQGTVMVKVLLAVLSGLFAAVHIRGTSKLAIAVGGALGLLTALAALFLGILLHTAG